MRFARPTLAGAGASARIATARAAADAQEAPAIVTRVTLALAMVRGGICVFRLPRVARPAAGDRQTSLSPSGRGFPLDGRRVS
jgi:hypothetical protein